MVDTAVTSSAGLKNNFSSCFCCGVQCWGEYCWVAKMGVVLGRKNIISGSD